MRTLHLLRHAKSSAKENIGDHERPLSRRGREAAQQLGNTLPAAFGALDLVFAGLSPRSVVEDELYLATRENLIQRLRLLDDRDVNVMVVGHNPGLHELAIALADKNSPRFRALAAKFPTTACASFHAPDRWEALGTFRHELIDYFTPESLAGGKR